jgi:hypothetical protein
VNGAKPPDMDRRPSRETGAPETQTDADLNSGSTVREGTAADVTHRAAELVAAAWAPALERSHRLGWETGYRRGWLDGQRAEHDGWMAVLGACRRTLRQPTAAELVARRAADRACACDRCSACIRRRAVEANRTKYGADDYPGQVAS